MTTQRRPHWDDELIESLPIPGHSYLEDEDIYAIIAAVEDWHKAKRDSRIRTHSEGCWRWHNECAEGLIEAQQRKIQQLANQLLNEVPDSYIQMKARALTAEAAIARVRQVLDEEQRGYNPPLGLISRIKTALEGDSDD